MKPHRILSLVAALGLFAMLIPATTSLVLAWSAPGIASVCSSDQAVHNWTVTLSTEADYNIEWADNAGFASPTKVLMHAGANSLSTPATVVTLYVRWFLEPGTKSSAVWSGDACPTPTEMPTQTSLQTRPPQQAVELTLIKVLCPSYSVVPANNDPTNIDQTGGHGGELNTSYQTVLVNPATDIPTACTRTDGWQFQLSGGPSLAPTIGSPLTTGADGAGTGAVSVWLDASELALAQTGGSPTGLWVAEIGQPSVATFGALRCYTDIINGDNVENIRSLGTSNQHIYCIAYNVVVSQPTAPPTEAPTATPTTEATATPCIVGVANPAAFSTDTSCPTPFESFQGETATPRQTATPPPTNSASSSSSGGATPLFALLICFLFGGIGLTAAQFQRRSIRR